MKDFLATFVQQLKDAPLASKAVLAVSLVVFVVVGLIASDWASRPSFALLYSGLDERQSAAVQAALATGNVRYRASQPPGPYTIQVDEGQYYAAQNAVALAGALERAPAGIQTGASGAAQVFLSAPERAQNVLKREWQELERQLEELDFVLRARVSTSTPDPSPLRKATPLTVAVMLTLKNAAELTRSQSQTVAKLVRFRFNVPSENVVISDQSGRSLHDGSDATPFSLAANELSEHRRRHDDDLEKRTNGVLERIFGAGMAYVVVSSEWKFEENESVKETLDPQNKVVVSETTSKTTSPSSGGGAGGAAGVSANLASEFGATNAAVGPAGGSEGGGQSSESQKSTLVGRETSLRRSSTPTLERLSVSLFLDESLKDRLAQLETGVKSAVGFDPARNDVFSSLVTPFASVKRDESGAVLPPAEPAPIEEPSLFMETLLPRGVEILAALAFLFVLFKALKGLTRSAGSGSQASVGGLAAPAGVTEEQFVEMLARSQVEELVRSDPARVSSVLSRWANEQAEPAKASR